MQSFRKYWKIVLAYWQDVAIFLSSAAFVYALSYSWQWFAQFLDIAGPSTQLEASAIVRNYGLVLAGIVGFVLAVIRLRFADRQHKLEKRSALFDRFQRSSAMLDSPKTTTRQAGIHVLAEIAVEEPKEFYLLVLNLFCSFLRDASDEQREESKIVDDGFDFVGKARKQDWPKPRGDMIDALRKVAILISKNRSVPAIRKIEIPRLNLRDLFVPGYTLTDIEFYNCNFTEANFADTVLRDVNFIACNLDKACFDRAKIRDGTFSNCSGAILFVRWTAFFNSVFSPDDFGAIDSADSLMVESEKPIPIEASSGEMISLKSKELKSKFPTYSSESEYYMARDDATESELIQKAAANLRKDQEELQRRVNSTNPQP